MHRNLHSPVDGQLILCCPWVRSFADFPFVYQFQFEVLSKVFSSIFDQNDIREQMPELKHQTLRSRTTQCWQARHIFSFETPVFAVLLTSMALVLFECRSLASPFSVFCRGQLLLPDVCAPMFFTDFSFWLVILQICFSQLQLYLAIRCVFVGRCLTRISGEKKTSVSVSFQRTNLGQLRFSAVDFSGREKFKTGWNANFSAARSHTQIKQNLNRIYQKASSVFILARNLRNCSRCEKSPRKCELGFLCKTALLCRFQFCIVVSSGRHMWHGGFWSLLFRISKDFDIWYGHTKTQHHEKYDDLNSGSQRGLGLFVFITSIVHEGTIVRSGVTLKAAIYRVHSMCPSGQVQGMVPVSWVRTLEPWLWAEYHCPAAWNSPLKPRPQQAQFAVQIAARIFCGLLKLDHCSREPQVWPYSHLHGFFSWPVEIPLFHCKIAHRKQIGFE